MDQCVAMGADAIGLMEFQRSKCSVRVIPNAKTLYFVVADIGASKDTVVILRDLNNCFPVPKSATEVRITAQDSLGVNIDLLNI